MSKKAPEPVAAPPPPLYPGPSDYDLAIIDNLCLAHNAQMDAAACWRDDAWRRVKPDLLLKVWHRGAETWHGVNGKRKRSDRHNRSLHCLDRMRAFLVCMKHLRSLSPLYNEDFTLLPPEHPMHGVKRVSLLEITIAERELNKRLLSGRDDLLDILDGGDR
jgi:hypothetical protein